VNGWLETYRGIVYRWQEDHNGHLTVAFYFAHLGDATLCALESLGLGLAYTRRRKQLCVTTDCYVRYVRELRVGDNLHIASGLIGVERDGLVLGHKLFNTESGEVCTTVEERLRHVDSRRRAPRAFTAAQRRAIEARRVEWDAPARERRPRPSGLEGFHETSRDTVKPEELDVLGRVALTHFVHRFSGANGHATAVFGVTPGYMRTERRGFSTFEFQMEFTNAELRAGDPLRTRSALLHVGNSSMRLFHVMTNERTGERVAALEQLGVHLDMDARRPTPLPDSIRDRAKAILVS
jgi:acyl-CoA thioester hydrolase